MSFEQDILELVANYYEVEDVYGQETISDLVKKELKDISVQDFIEEAEIGLGDILEGFGNSEILEEIYQNSGERDIVQFAIDKCDAGEYINNWLEQTKPDQQLVLALISNLVDYLRNGNKNNGSEA